jgi:hypothetical protein
MYLLVIAAANFVLFILICVSGVIGAWFLIAALANLLRRQRLGLVRTLWAAGFLVIGYALLSFSGLTGPHTGSGISDQSTMAMKDQSSLGSFVVQFGEYRADSQEQPPQIREARR